MSTSTRNVEGYSSSELSSDESQSTLSDVSAPSSTPKKTIVPRKTNKNAPSRPSHQKPRYHSTRRESIRLRSFESRNYAESSSSETESVRPKPTRGREKGKESRRDSISSKYRVTKRPYTKRAVKQKTPPTSLNDIQATSAQQGYNNQRHHLLSSENLSNPSGTYMFNNEFNTQHIDKHGSQGQIPWQENTTTFNSKAIDPNLLSLDFIGPEAFDWSLPLPPDPILLSIGKPIRIPIWEFRNFKPIEVLDDEASDLALSDYEAETEVGPAPQRESRKRKQVIEPDLETIKPGPEKRVKRPYRKRQRLTTDTTVPYRVTKSRADGPSPAPTITATSPQSISISSTSTPSPSPSPPSTSTPAPQQPLRNLPSIPSVPLQIPNPRPQYLPTFTTPLTPTFLSTYFSTFPSSSFPSTFPSSSFPSSFPPNPSSSFPPNPSPIPPIPTSLPPPPAQHTSTNLQRSRFLLLMHLYWGQTPRRGLTASLNCEYEGEQGAAPWSVEEVERMLEEAMREEGLEAYRRRWGDAAVVERRDGERRGGGEVR